MHNLYELAYQNSPTAQLSLCAQTDQILLANKAFKKLINAGEDLHSYPVSTLFKDCLPELVVFTDEVINKRAAVTDSLTICSPCDQKRIRLEVRASARADRKNNIVEMVVVDANEMQKRLEQIEADQHHKGGLLRWKHMSAVFSEFERENRLLLEAAGEGIYGVDAEGITTFLNPAAERLLGWPAEELIGHAMHYVIHSRHEDGSPYPAKACPIYWAFRDGLMTVVDDEVFWTKSGTPINVEYTSTPVKDNGKVVGAVIIFRDVTEKKQAQQNLVEALEQVALLKKRLELENAYLQEEIDSEFNHHQIIGKSIAIQRTIKEIELVAPTDASVLINGESGTGKELIARAIHQLSNRSSRSLIRVNCASIPYDLFESEFFGHKKGSFTGAISDRPGRFELADGGTLFLDEVGEIPLELQGKLLRVLQEQQFERVGDSATRDVDVRIIAATNRDLQKMVTDGTFREDLFFRLNVFPIFSAPLRDRRDDISLLAQHFLEKAVLNSNKPNAKIPLSELNVLENYDWPGNIRELENVIERQVILANGDLVRFQNLKSSPTSRPRTTGEPQTNTLLTYCDIEEIEKRNINAVLKKTRGKVFGREGAAEILQVKPTTLASRLKKLNIDTAAYKSS